MVRVAWGMVSGEGLRGAVGGCYCSVYGLGTGYSKVFIL